MLLAAPDFIAERGLRDVAWLQGMGWATEPGFLGDRDLTSAPALAAAARQAYAAAGIADPAKAFDLAEVTDATPYAELLAYEALSLCPREAWHARATDGSFARGGRLPVNLSGGVLTWNPVFCTGLIRIAEVANQIRRRAGPHQSPNARRGLAHAGSGFAMQYQAAVVLGREARA
jgi:acetyl-CoA C-acetyltransferase